MTHPARLLALLPFFAFAAAGRAQTLVLDPYGPSNVTVSPGPIILQGTLTSGSRYAFIYTDLKEKFAQYAPQYDVTYTYNISWDFAGGYLAPYKSYQGFIVTANLALKPGAVETTVPILIPHVEFGVDEFDDFNQAVVPAQRGIYRDFTIVPTPQAVPEPATLLVLAPGLLALRRRRKRA